MDKDILFWSFLGAGDQVACNGIVHYLKEKHQKKIYVPTKKRNFHNINFMYKDFDDIEVIAIEGERFPQIKPSVDRIIAEKNLHLIRTTITDYSRGKHWDQTFYANLGLDYSIKHDYAILPEVDEAKIMKRYVSHEKYAFVYDDEDRGLTFNPQTELPVVKNITELTMFEMVPIIKNATEIHAMVGGLMCVMELLQLPLKGQRAFLYPIRDNYGFYNKEKFEVING